MKEALQQILDEAKKKLQEAECIQDAEDIRVKMLGKKGQLTSILKSMGSLSPEERKELGMQANKAKSELRRLSSEQRRSTLRNPARSINLEPSTRSPLRSKRSPKYSSPWGSPLQKDLK